MVNTNAELQNSTESEGTHGLVSGVGTHKGEPCSRILPLQEEKSLFYKCVFTPCSSVAECSC